VWEAPAPERNAFQRDRDRIVHSTAFRRLVYKTQVFLNHEGDLFRTRLTHSLEVAQLARSMARSLGLHEDLVEALALAHDLGHTPFGHAGQDALNACMRGHGGFEHNLQSLRVVDVLEQRYPDFDGLNLCFETREGILKHCSSRVARHIESLEPEGVAHRFVAGYQPSLEAQLCNLADEIAYNAHDVDDGVRSGLITLSQLLDLGLVRRFHEEAVREHPGLPRMGRRRLLSEVLRRMLSAQVHDLIATTRANLVRSAPADAWQARQGAPLVVFSAPMRESITELKRFLFRALYRHAQVVAQTQRGKAVVRELFVVYAACPSEMPAEYAQRPDVHRAVADYVAGMTDRFAVREHERLTGRRLFG
jgi:dGTPase